MGKEVVGGNEEGDLDDETYRTAQGIRWMVVILPIEGGEHHVLLITLEGILDPCNARQQTDVLIAFFLLQFLCNIVETQCQKVHYYAYGCNGKPPIHEALIEKP